MHDEVRSFKVGDGRRLADTLQQMLEQRLRQRNAEADHTLEECEARGELQGAQRVGKGKKLGFQIITRWSESKASCRRAIVAFTIVAALI